MAKTRALADHSGKQVGYFFHCPGCDLEHVIYDRAKYGKRPSWVVTGGLHNPTFSPSVLVRRGNKTVCHSFVEKGYIRFLLDSTHDLAGQTVELPELDR